MPEGSILAFDYGLKRIGVAVGNTLVKTASPLVTLDNDDGNHDGDQLMQKIDTLMTDWQPVGLLLGQPEDRNTSSKKLIKRINHFGATLRSRYDLSVTFVDERFSSQEAEQRLISQRRQGRSQKVKKHEIDQQAAVIILERWLDTL